MVIWVFFPDLPVGNMEMVIFIQLLFLWVQCIYTCKNILYTHAHDFYTRQEGRNTCFWEINISAKTEFVICIQNYWICAVNEEIFKNIIIICAQFLISADSVGSNEPLDIFGTLELLFPISRKEFILALFQFPNTTVRNLIHCIILTWSCFIPTWIVCSWCCRVWCVMCFVYIQHVTYRITKWYLIY